MTSIPNKIKDKVIDIDWNKTFKFETMDNSNPDVINSKTQEAWLEDELTKQDPSEELIVKGKTYKLSKITVLRGRYDDCIGTNKEFT